MGEQKRGTRVGLQTAVKRVIMSQEEKEIEGNTLEGRGAYVAMTLSRECGKNNSVVEKRIGS